MARIVIVTGSRDWTDLRAILDVVEVLCPNLVMHGACPTGADSLVSMWADDNEVPALKFRPDWNAFGRSAGPVRNQDMADAAKALADTNEVICLAFPIDRSKGTWDCLRRMKCAGIQCYVYDQRSSKWQAY